MNNYQVNDKGYYGEYGGTYIPENLSHCVEELRENYIRIIESPEFKEEYHKLLREYVGRPSTLYLTNHLSKKHGC